MEKKVENSKLEDNRGNLVLECRKKLTMTGIVEVISFDEEKIMLNTKLGPLTIKGLGLKMNKLDVQNGDVIIVGEISAMIYSSKEIKKEKESIRMYRLQGKTIKEIAEIFSCSVGIIHKLINEKQNAD